MGKSNGWSSKSKCDRIATILIVVVIGSLFAFYILRSIKDTLGQVGGGRFALFFLVVGAALLVGRLRRTEKRFYGGVAMFFGLGQTWDAVAHFHSVPTSHGLNIEWSQMGPMLVAALFVADGWAMFWAGRRKAQPEHVETSPLAGER